MTVQEVKTKIDNIIDTIRYVEHLIMIDEYCAALDFVLKLPDMCSQLNKIVLRLDNYTYDDFCNEWVLSEIAFIRKDTISLLRNECFHSDGKAITKDGRTFYITETPNQNAADFDKSISVTHIAAAMILAVSKFINSLKWNVSKTDCLECKTIYDEKYKDIVCREAETCFKINLYGRFISDWDTGCPMFDECFQCPKAKMNPQQLLGKGFIKKSARGYDCSTTPFERLSIPESIQGDVIKLITNTLENINAHVRSKLTDPKEIVRYQIQTENGGTVSLDLYVYQDEDDS